MRASLRSSNRRKCGCPCHGTTSTLRVLGEIEMRGSFRLALLSLLRRRGSSKNNDRCGRREASRSEVVRPGGGKRLQVPSDDSDHSSAE